MSVVWKSDFWVKIPQIRAFNSSGAVVKKMHGKTSLILISTSTVYCISKQAKGPLITNFFICDHPFTHKGKYEFGPRVCCISIHGIYIWSPAQKVKWLTAAYIYPSMYVYACLHCYCFSELGSAHTERDKLIQWFSVVWYRMSFHRVYTFMS